MNVTWWIRSVCALGGLAWMASIGVVFGVILVEAVGGPPAGQAIWPDVRLWRYFMTTVLMSGGAAILAIVLAIPPALALVAAGRSAARWVIGALIVMPLVTMPSVFAYAWLLVATEPALGIASLLHALGWNDPGAAPVRAAVVIATWLWPIPAWAIAAGFEHGGAAAYQLAGLDASPPRAFICGALPVLRGPLLAAGAAVFVIAAIDTTAAPLIGAVELWGHEMMADARTAIRFDRPAGFLFWRSWPMLLLIGLAAAAAAPGIRQMSTWGATAPTADQGSTLAGSRRWAWIGGAVAAFVVGGPIVIFAVLLGTGRDAPAAAFTTALTTFRDAGLASLIVAILTAMSALALATLAITDPTAGRATRTLAVVVVIASVACAVLPPELIGTALVSFYVKISPPARWNLYDHTPWVWVAAMLARFAFVPVCVAAIMNRRVPAEVVDQAATDGATGLQRIAHARWPMIRASVITASAVAGCLAISEVAASTLVQPTQFLGGVLSVAVDAQMHYQRQDETVAATLLIMVPAIIGALIVGLLAARSDVTRKTRRPRS